MGGICIYQELRLFSGCHPNDPMFTIAVPDTVGPCTDSHDSWSAVAYVLFIAILPAVSIWSRSRSSTVLFHDSFGCLFSAWMLLSKKICCCLQLQLLWTVVVIVLGWCTPHPPQPSSWPASWRNAPPTRTALTLSAMTWATPINNDLGHSVSGVLWVIELYAVYRKRRGKLFYKILFLCNFYIFMLQLFIACCPAVWLEFWKTFLSLNLPSF